MALSDADKAEITGIITAALEPALKASQEGFAAMVSGAVAKERKAIEAKIPQALDKDILSALVKEQLEAARAASAEVAAGGTAEGGPAKPNPEVLKALERIEKLEKENKRVVEESRLKEESSARNQEDSALALALGEHLKGKGPAVIEAAKLLIRSRGAVVRNEKGEISYKVTRKHGGMESDELLPLVDGVKEWAASPEAQDFLPPKDVGGGGDPRRARGGNGAGGGNLADKRNEFLSGLR
jgi:hypothetical protein